jgi:hypothetical protein
MGDSAPHGSTPSYSHGRACILAGDHLTGPAAGRRAGPPSSSQAVPHGSPYVTPIRLRALRRNVPGSDAGFRAPEWRGERQSGDRPLRFVRRPAGEASEARDSQAALRSDTGRCRRGEEPALTGSGAKSRLPGSAGRAPSPGVRRPISAALQLEVPACSITF